MKNNTKRFAAMMAAVMAVSAMAPMSAFAADTKHDAAQKYDNTTDAWDKAFDDQTAAADPSAKVNVTFENDPTYTVTIPADVTFADDMADKTNEVKVEDVYLNKGKAVKVTVASANDYKMILNGTDADTFVPYELTSDKAEGGDVITVPTGTFNRKGTDTATLTYKVTDKDIPYAGDYSDILTFTIAVVDDNASPAVPAPDMITITNSDYPGTSDFTTDDGFVNVSFTNPSGDYFENYEDINGWFFYGKNSTTTVTAADGYTIDKVKFYTKAENGTGVAEVTSAPFTVYSGSGYHTYTGPNNTGTDLGAWGVNKIEVYFK